MADLVTFLNDRLDEDEKIARAVNNPAPWRTAMLDSDGDPIEMELVYDAANNPVLYVESRHQTVELAAHIARHDPARVLADVTAKRAILDQYISDRDATGYTELVSTVRRDRMEYVIRALANAWSDHPDFDPAWRIQVSPDAVGEHH